MSTKGKYKKANRLFNNGQFSKATPLFLEVYKKTTNERILLEVATKLVPVLNLAKHRKELYDLTTIGIRLSKKCGDKEREAYFMIRKAQFLNSDSSFLIAERKNIKLPHNWVEFALKRDEKKYNSLTKKISQKKQEVNELCEEVQEMMEKYKFSPDSRAHVLCALSDIYSNKYLDYHIEHLSDVNPFMLKLMNKHYFFKSGIRLAIVYGARGYKILKNYRDKCVDYALEASSLFSSERQILNSAYTLTNLAMNLTNFYDFKSAQKYISEAENLSKMLNVAELKSNISEIKKRVKTKNKDIPNYLDPVTGELLDDTIKP